MPNNPKIKYLRPTIQKHVLEMYSMTQLSKPITNQAVIVGKPEHIKKVKEQVAKLLSKVKLICRPRKITFTQGTSRKTSTFKIKFTEQSNNIWFAYGTLDKKEVKLLVNPDETHCEVIYL